MWGAGQLGSDKQKRSRKTMRQLRSIGLCVLAALALGAVASAGAWAEAPEIGRCIKHAGGKFKDAGCKTEAKLTTEQKFEWYPGDGSPSPKTAESKPLVKTHFTTKLKEGSGLAKLETGGGVAVTCVNQTSEGEFTGAKTVSVSNVAFTGCESGGFTCISINPKGSQNGRNQGRAPRWRHRHRKTRRNPGTGQARQRPGPSGRDPVHRIRMRPRKGQSEGPCDFTDQDKRDGVK